jgi:hypothetical protein
VKKIKSILNLLADSAVRAAFGENEYEQAKSEIIMFFPDNQQSQVEAIFDKIETTNPRPEQIKQYLSEILKLAAQDKKNKLIDAEDYNVILEDICKILDYYNIASEKCKNGINTTHTDQQTSDSS